MLSTGPPVSAGPCVPQTAQCRVRSKPKHASEASSQMRDALRSTAGRRQHADALGAAAQQANMLSSTPVELEKPTCCEMTLASASET